MTPPAYVVQQEGIRTPLELSIERRPDPEADGLSRADAAWPRRLRRIVRAGLTHWGRPDLTETAELLLTELATNALRHGQGDVIGVRVYLDGARCVIEVTDGSPLRPELRQAGPTDEGGRGLFLVEAMADAWGTSPDGTRTWCSISLCKGPDDPMHPAPVPALRTYPQFSIPGDPSAPSRARAITRSALSIIGWQGDLDAATAVVSHLVENAVAHGVMPDFPGESVTVRLCLNADGQLVIDIDDPHPKFPDFEAALAGELGRGLREVRRSAEVSWFTPPDLGGKTVRAIMTPGEADL
ncbi:anti-sigma regulatory factor (Ser/Thr protein kinase) [Streptomyces sp. LBL]|uniref:ATP-binding protein n=1 Tax=Streptomyces sp. LBL TaxID=2940562 RepID=UPI0024761166|nr:ATP-binding protein [Streptomyces sp. LBL]MDH6629424.1 anti-sigma regulatory factor (Ser/Thr protein kinase) [Streptomyces sp. LBL]